MSLTITRMYYIWFIVDGFFVIFMIIFGPYVPLGCGNYECFRFRMKSVEYYDLRNNKWFECQEMSVRRSALSLVQLDLPKKTSEFLQTEARECHCDMVASLWKVCAPTCCEWPTTIKYLPIKLEYLNSCSRLENVYFNIWKYWKDKELLSTQLIKGIQ